MPKISALPTGSNLDTTELVAVVQDGVTVQATLDDIRGSATVNIKDFGGVGGGSGTAATDLAAFRAFRDWARLQGTTRIKLIVPPGEYEIAEFDGSWIFAGVKHVTMEAYGATLSYVVFGSLLAIVESSFNSRLIQTVSRGSTTVTMVTTSDSTLYDAGDWVYISCIDVQGYGSPPNNHIFEFQQISAVDDGTGIITLNEKLVNDYKSTYPVFNAGDGNHPHCGGPAMMYKLDADWDCENYVYGGKFYNTGQFKFSGQRAAFIDCEFDGSWAPTQCRQIGFERCRFTEDMEADKAVQLLQFNNCEIQGITTQSSSINILVIDGCRFSTALNGTTKNTVVKNSTVPSLKCGPLAYGIMETLYLEDCVIGDVLRSEHDITFGSFTISNGVVTVPIASGPLQSFTVPGAVYSFASSGLPFKILDVTQVSTNYLVTTTLPQPMVTPPIPGGGGVALNWNQWNGHGKIRAVNCTGCKKVVDLSNSNGLPLYAYLKRYYTGSVSDTTALTIGLIESVTINVIRAYSGTTGTLTIGHTDWCINQTANTGGWTTIFDVNTKIVGKRVISPSGNSGAQSGDTLLDMTSIRYWKIGDSGAAVIGLSSSISGETVAKSPIVSVEIVTSQGDVFTDNWVYGSTFIG